MLATLHSVDPNLTGENERHSLKEELDREEWPALRSVKRGATPPSANVSQEKVLQLEQSQEESPEGLSADRVTDDHLSPVALPDTTSKQSSEKGRLRKVHRIYGRVEEQKMLHETYRKAISESPNRNFVVISGAAGVGKTMLAESLQDTVKKKGGFFVHFRFHHDSQIESGDGFVDAFSSLAQQITESEDLKEIQATIHDLGPDDNSIILDMMPMMQPVIGNVNSCAKGDGINAQGRQFAILNGYMNALCSINRPLVMVFDSLQFSDTCVQMLVEHLVLDTPNNEGIFYMATVDDEICPPRIQQLLRRLEEKLTVTKIELKALPEKIMNHMVADILHVDSHVSAPMTSFLQSHCKGNPRLAIETLLLMRETDVLSFEEETRTWKCNEENISLVYECKDFEALHKRKLMQLPSNTQEVLKMAAFFGGKFYLCFLRMVTKVPVEECLTVALDSELVVSTDNPDAFFFATEGIQQAAYHLVPEEERAALHLMIGRKLSRGLSDDKLGQNLSTVVSHIKRGATALKNQEERNGAAALFLRSAKKSVDWSSFKTAADSLDFALTLLGDRCWRDDYDLTLALYNCGAEIAYALGKFDEAVERIQQVLNYARQFDDKLPAYYTLLCVLGSKEDGSAAIAQALEILVELGERIPSDPSPRQVKREYLKTKRLLSKMSPEKLLRLPTMTDPRKAAVIQIMNLIFMPSFFEHPHLCAVLTSRAMQITVSYGLCAISSFIVGIYGMLVCSMEVGGINDGVRYGEASLKILERFETRQWIPRVYAVVYGCIYQWKKNVRPLIEQLERGRAVGYETGDNQFAMLNGNIIISYRFALGEPLPLIYQEISAQLEGTASLNQAAMREMQKPFGFMIKLLMEGDGSPEFLEKISINSSCFITGYVTSTMSFWLSFQAGAVAYVFGDYEHAVLHMNNARPYDAFPFRQADVSFFWVFDALANIGSFRKTRKGGRKKLAIVRSRIKHLEKLAQANPVFFLGKANLVKAELAAVQKDHANAQNLYVSACAMYSSEKQLMELALAKELAGRYFLAQGERGIAQQHLEEAVTRYNEWGAPGKASILQKECTILF